MGVVLKLIHWLGADLIPAVDNYTRCRYIDHKREHGNTIWQYPSFRTEDHVLGNITMTRSLVKPGRPVPRIEAWFFSLINLKGINPSILPWYASMIPCHYVLLIKYYWFNHCSTVAVYSAGSKYNNFKDLLINRFSAKAPYSHDC